MSAMFVGGIEPHILFVYITPKKYRSARICAQGDFLLLIDRSMAVHFRKSGQPASIGTENSTIVAHCARSLGRAVISVCSMNLVTICVLYGFMAFLYKM